MTYIVVLKAINALASGAIDELIDAVAGQFPDRQVLEIAPNSTRGAEYSITDLNNTEVRGLAGLVRRTAQAGAFPTDIGRTDVLLHGTIVNCDFHDLHQPAAFASPVPNDVLVIGCNFRNNGWRSTDAVDARSDGGGHGHAMYTQCQAPGYHTFRASITAGGYGYGAQMYGSSNAYLDNFTWEDHIFYGKRNVIGGGRPIRGAAFRRCDFLACPTKFGYNAALNESLEVTDCLFGDPTGTAKDFTRVIFMGNVVYGSATEVLHCGPEMHRLHDPALWQWDYNTYCCPRADGKAFAIDGYGWLTLAEWQAVTGLDAHSVLIRTPQVDPVVRIHPVNAGKHTLNLGVYNPTGLPGTVTVTLPLDAGVYQLRQQQDYDHDRRVFNYGAGGYALSLDGTYARPMNAIAEDDVCLPGKLTPEVFAAEVWNG